MLELTDALRDMEKVALEEALKRNDDNLTKAARDLGISFRQARYRAHKYGIRTPHPSRDKKAVLYFLQADAAPFLVKVGFSEHFQQRLIALRCGSPVALNVLGTHEGTLGDEAKIKAYFKKFKSHGEWHRPEPELLKFISDLCR